MIKLTVDGRLVAVEEGSTILEAARIAGTAIPTLCYLKDINEISACRICVVEVEGLDRLVPACSAKAAEGMVVRTNTPRVREARETNLKLILAEHNESCSTCVRSGNCSLQSLAADFNLQGNEYGKSFKGAPWDASNVLIRDESKCIRCMRCVQICDKVQSLSVWDAMGSGGRAKVVVADGKSFKEAACALCGQCITHCPVGALYVRDDTRTVLDKIADPDTVTVCQVAPAVRSAWAESLGLSKEEATLGRMTAALKRLGFDYVFDTDFAADLTIMEEGSELLEKLKKRSNEKLPLFTSCCPGWVRFVKREYPEFVGQLSSAKSPQQMFGAVTKSYFAEKAGLDPHRIFVVSIMPCTAKKAECAESNQNDACGDPDVDLSLTTRELARMIRMNRIDVRSLSEEPFDSPLGESTGAAVIFGATGGVMVAALRSAYFLLTGKNIDPDAFKAVAGPESRKEAEVEIPGFGKLRIAVVSGLANARALLEDLKNGRVSFDFVEVMACPGGCAGGGGQPIHDGLESAACRSQILWQLDRDSAIRYSHENPEVNALYKNYLGAPLSEKAHHLLHTDHNGWQL